MREKKFLLNFRTPIFLSIFLLLSSCGGSSGAAAVTPLAFSGENLSIMNSVAVTQDEISGATSVSSSRIYKQKNNKVAGSKSNFFLRDLFSYLVLIEPAYAQQNNSSSTTIITEDTVMTYPIFPVELDVDYFAMPTAIRTGNTYLAISGDFNVTNQAGNSVRCNVLVSDFYGSKNVNCLYVSNANDSNEIPLAVIRDGSTEGDYENFDSVYFVVNKKNGGFVVYKYNGTTTSAVLSSPDGKITKLLSGKSAILGFDLSGATDKLIFGNNSFDEGVKLSNGNTLGLIHLNKPINYKYLAVYIDRVTDGSGIQPLFFDLDFTTITTYTPTEVTTNCPTSPEEGTQAVHNKGIIWISEDKTKLCEAYERDIPTPPLELTYRFLDQSATWENVAISNETLVAIASFNGVNRLIIEPIEFTLNVNATPVASNYNFNDKLISADLDSATSLEHYANGIIIRGVKNGINVSRYCDTRLGDGVCLFEALGNTPIVFNDRTDIPN